MLRNLSATYQQLQIYINNSYWMVGEKIIALGVKFVATVVVARHLGPEHFGILAYALSMTALFAAAGHMGLHGLVVREIVRDPKNRGEILGTVATLKFLGMFLGYIALLIYAIWYEGLATKEFYLIVIAGAALLFRPLDVIEFWFQAFIQARYTAVARVTSHFASAVFQLLLVFAGSSIIFFATAQILEAALAGLILVLLFSLKSKLPFTEWRFRWSRAIKLLNQGWLIFLGSIFAVIYLKVDQVMLRWLADTQQVGQYAVAAQLSEVWYFIPTAIAASVFPKLINIHVDSQQLFSHRLQQLFDLLFMLGLVIAIVMTFASRWIVSMFFGADYYPSSEILIVHIWSGVFIFMRAALSKWILIKNAFVLSVVTQGLGAVTNIALNYYVIPLYGGLGAAWATLISYSMASFFSLFAFQRTRPVFWNMARAMLSPVRYPMQLMRRYH